ncbi:hypothetical protein [uncultured Gimesia sp.]|uniref:hypothetical protein n=1 Tax=uncultured Gimesia sp. TaxID=1678688 RepID=UPI0026249740|nr:hypothetical protein [uncultured Gimesia sp.]
MLHANDIPAHVMEDQSGVSLWALGTISQFHQPNVWVDKSTSQKAAQFILRFEETRKERENPDLNASTDTIPVECEECGTTTFFPGTLSGTTQDCSKCSAYLDVGELPWEEDFGVPDE